MTIFIYGLGVYVLLTFVVSVVGSLWGIAKDDRRDEDE
jgi:hypothetical protein